MSYREEFHDFDMDILIPEHWQDVSLGRCSCPAFRNWDKMVFVDWKDPKLREHEDALRFCVFQIAKNRFGSKELLSTDDFEAVKRLMG